ncbi:hypothetical protein [Maridesulfovibrio sp.]|nr:hypothetical protein [Maridesulfovibrio sp.]
MKQKNNHGKTYNIRNEGYTVENAEAFVGIEFDNVKLPHGVGGWA